MLRAMSKPAPRFAEGPRSKLFRRGLFAAVFLQFVAHLITLSPGVTPSDGPEIAAAVVTLGVIHPTGYPLFTIVAHLFTWLPLPVEPVIKIEFMNACCVAGASICAALSVRSLALVFQGAWPVAPHSLRRRWPKLEPASATEQPPVLDSSSGSESPRVTWEADISGIIAGVLLGIGPLLWEQLRIPEVYAMHVFLVTAALYFWTRFEVTRRPRYVLLAAVPMGLGLAHHVTMVYMLPAAGVYLLLRRPYLLVAWFVAPLTWLARLLGAKKLLSRTDFSHWWIVWVGCVIGGVPLLLYAYFLWAHENTTGVSWGGVTNWHTLYSHMTGKQYQGYMKGLEYPDLWKRAAGIPTWFDKHYLAGAFIPWLVGLVVLFRRAWPFGILLVAYGLLNLYHGVQYSVGDYRTYFLPAFTVCSLLLGLGFWWIARRVCYRPQGRSAVVWGLVCAAVMLTFAGAAFYYGHYAKPRPGSLPRNADVAIVAPLVGAALLAIVAPLWFRRRRGPKSPAPLYPGLSLCLLGVACGVYLTVGVLRTIQFQGKVVGGANYAAGVVRAVPPGGVYITIGDGKIFPMWYSQHVLNEGREIAVIDDRMIHRHWYRVGYLTPRHPAACDPVDPRYIDDLQLFFEECGDYGQRLAKYAENKKSWLKLDVGTSRSARRTKRPTPLTLDIRHGGDKRCKKADYRRKNYKQCTCWDYNEYERAWDLQCVYTSEEKAIIRLNEREIHAHRIIEDHIDERPVFEGNMFTRRVKRAKSGRGWTGPAYRRVSGQYHLVNRGRINQVLYWADVEGIDTCAGDTLEVLPQPERKPATTRMTPAAERTAYQINERPQLMSYSLITPMQGGVGDDEKFAFGLSEDVHLAMRWFERNLYNSKRKTKKGARVLHGVRVCFFDPDGKKLHTTAVRTVGKTGQVHLPSELTVKPGTYTVQACTVGQLPPVRGRPSAKGRGVPDDMPCLFPVLEYTFDVTAEVADG